VITSPIVAVVDDESPVRTMLGRVLRLAGYRVTSFASGEDFLASLTGPPPACAVLDIHMPGLSGLDVHTRMRAAGIATPVVFMTASDDAALEGSTRKLAAHLLHKPFPSEEMVKVVAAAIASRNGP
jgi:FixJ family two-component response regulator